MREPEAIPGSKPLPATPCEGGRRLRPIAVLDLAAFEPPVVAGNRGPFWRAAWYVTNALVFQSTLLALVPSRLKAGLLRAFGARIGAGFVCKPRVTIKYPWFLEFGDHVWIGEGVWLDGLAPIRLGANVVVSQGCYLGNGNHDWSDPRFPFFAKPIEIGDGVWITAGQRVLGGERIPPHHAVLAERG